MLDREATIVLNMIPGIGHVRYTALKEAFGSPAAVFGRTAEELEAVPGVGPQLAEKVASYDWEAGLRAELDLCDRAGVRILTLWDEAYPQILRTLYDPPLCLYVRGKLPPFPNNAVAVVGTRRMTQYGARMTRMITEEAVAAGYAVVSGLAFGVDTVAHSAAVEMNGVTVAVLGGGLMRIHPQENVPLARRIVETGGALVSEFPMMCPVSRTTFPRRNRIVAGMCCATIVTEAGVGCADHRPPGARQLPRGVRGSGARRQYAGEGMSRADQGGSRAGRIVQRCARRARGPGRIPARTRAG